MKMRHERPRVCHRVDDFIREQIGLNAADAVACDSGQCIQRADEIEKRLSVRGAEVADVHTGEHDFLCSGVNRFFRLVDRGIHIGTARASARQWNGAEGAEIIAAVLYFQKRARAIAGAERRDERLDILDFTGEHFAGRLIGAAHVLHQIKFLSGAEYDVYAFNGGDFLRFQLRIATNNRYIHIGIVANGPADNVPALLIRLIRHAAGIDHKHVGVGVNIHTAVTRVGELARDGAGFCKIELAAEGVKGNSARVVHNGGAKLSDLILAMMKQVVIIGNGISGVTAAIHIRQRSSCGITIISDEHPVFFSRTALMYVFMGHMKLEHTQPYESWFWKEKNITLIQDEVTAIRTEAHEITLRSGQTKSYDTLILATGSVPRRLDCAGEELDGVHVLYHVHDLKALEQRMRQGVKRAVVAGGGLVGIELTEMLRSRRMEVDFLIRESWYWQSVLPEPEARMLEAHITLHGVRLHFNKSIQAIHGDEWGRVQFAETEHAERHPCDLACVAIGVEPNVFVGLDSGIAIRRGFLVDEYLQTSAPDVYAIGDCAELCNPQINRRAIEPVWYTGRLMGEAVAKVICGEQEKYNPGVWFNSAKFFDLEYQVYGVVNSDGSDSLYWQDRSNKRCLRLQLSADNTVVGIHAIGIRLRQEVCEGWIVSGASAEEVIRTLGQACFDPEFTSNPFAAIIKEFEQTLLGSA